MLPMSLVAEAFAVEPKRGPGGGSIRGAGGGMVGGAGGGKASPDAGALNAAPAIGKGAPGGGGSGAPSIMPGTGSVNPGSWGGSGLKD
mmetsp:Transcript_119969/g.212057  ORF Transcript_119969/g.212057 Transcript_119969/m.212057 type:complete len:88 (-) Transcript_119969:57-320(-)